MHEQKLNDLLILRNAETEATKAGSGTTFKDQLRDLMMNRCKRNTSKFKDENDLFKIKIN